MKTAIDRGTALPERFPRLSVLGCGWLGEPLARQFLAEGHQMKGSSTRSDKVAALRAAGIAAERLQFPQADAATLANLAEADALIVTLPPFGRGPEAGAAYAEALAGLARLAERRGAALVFTSSTGIYADVPGEVDEQGHTLPPEQSAVAAAEAALRANAQRQVILRLGGLVGGARHPVRYLAGRTQLPQPEAPVNLVHRDDVLRAIRQVLWAEPWGQVFNLVAPGHPARRAYYQHQAAALGLPLPQFDEADQRLGKCVDGSAISRSLGFAYEHPDPLAFAGLG